MGRHLCSAAVLAFLLATPACARATGPRVVSLPNPSSHPTFHVDAIADYGSAVATVSAIAERELGIAPFPLEFHFYPDRSAMEGALLASGYEPLLARQTARTMDGIGGHRRILLNEAALAPLSWRARLAVLAHEFAHSVQYELGGGIRGTSEQWLREGFAEWLSVVVMERLRAWSLGDARRRYRAELRARGRAAAPRLEEMVTFAQWVALGGRRDRAPYALAFLAVDLLIARHGAAAVIDYFSRFASLQDRETNFQAAFGEDLERFEVRLSAHLSGRPQAAGLEP